MTGTISSTPELESPDAHWDGLQGAPLEVRAGATLVGPGQGAELRGRGDLEVRVRGARPGTQVRVRIGDRERQIDIDDEGEGRCVEINLLGQVSGEVRVSARGHEVRLVVRPDKLSATAVEAVVEALDAVRPGLARSPGGAAFIGGARGADQELSRLDAAVGLAASAAPAVRRRPLHAPRERVKAVARDRGPHSARDLRWLATHPVQALRVELGGRVAGVCRSTEADLDVPENRSVLATYDRLEGRLLELRARLDGAIERIETLRPEREQFFTERANLFEERDRPRLEALLRRREHLDGLRREVRSARIRSGLPDLRPRSALALRSPRMESEPAYWSTYRAYRAAEANPALEPGGSPLAPLDELWERWCTVMTYQALERRWGPAEQGLELGHGWFADVRPGVVARWTIPDGEARLHAEPTIGATGEIQKLHPGRPWRPDLMLELRRGSRVDLHIFDAKYRREENGVPWSALGEVWTKYGDGIGDAEGWPLVRSVWIIWPGQGIRLNGPRMLDPAWPKDRLRGGALGLDPLESLEPLDALLGALVDY